MRFDADVFWAVALAMFKLAWCFDRSLGRALLLFIAFVTLPVMVTLGILFAVRF